MLVKINMIIDNRRWKINQVQKDYIRDWPCSINSHKNKGTTKIPLRNSQQSQHEEYCTKIPLQQYTSQIEIQVHTNSINNRVSNQTAAAQRIQLLATGNRYKPNTTELLEILSNSQFRSIIININIYISI